MFRSLLFLNAVCLTQWWIPFLFFRVFVHGFFRMKIIEDSADSWKISRFISIQWFWLVGDLKYGYGSIPIDTFLVGWTSINPSYDLGWTKGTRVLTCFEPSPYFLFSIIYGVIIPIDELIFFKMVIAPPTSWCLVFVSGLAIPWGDEWKALSHSVFDASCCLA